MHEAALARRILAAALEGAGRSGAARIRVVRGWVAETEALSAESLALHFQAHAIGTAAEGAALEMRLIHLDAKCAACGRTYATDHHVPACPTCGSMDASLVGEPGIRLETLEVEDAT